VAPVTQKLPVQEAVRQPLQPTGKGLMENRINVNQPGGMIQIDIKEDGTIFMTGTVGYIAEMSVAESFFS